MSKDNISKYRFWYLLLAFVPLWLLLLIFVMADAKAKGNKERDDSKKAADGLNIPNPKNDAFFTALDKRADKLLKQKDKIWEVAWKSQQDMQTWPNSDTIPLQQVLKDTPFGTEIRPPKDDKERQEDEWRRAYREVLYQEQFNRPEQFTDLVKPATFRDGWQAVITPVVWKDVPTNEECWLAQEDLWVRRELLRVLKDALDSVARFKRLDKKDNPARQRFRNPNWELDLIVEKDPKTNQLRISGDSTIKNVHVGKRALLVPETRLQLRQTRYKDKPIEMSIHADTAVAYNQTIKIKEAVPLPGFRADDFIEVEQVFTWKTSPIKRIDRVEAGTPAALGQRTFYAVEGALKARQLADNKPAAEPVRAATPQPTREGEASTPAAVDPNRTPNGLSRNRYLGEPSKQMALMPVGLVLVVDHAYLPDIQAAFVNARLDFLETQVQLQRNRDIRPPGEAPAPGTEPPPGSERPATSRPPGAVVPLPPSLLRGAEETHRVIPPGGTRPGFPPRGGEFLPGGVRPPTAGGPAADEPDPNLVELALYGTIKLYQPYIASEKGESPQQ